MDDDNEQECTANLSNAEYKVIFFINLCVYVSFFINLILFSRYRYCAEIVKNSIIHLQNSVHTQCEFLLSLILWNKYWISSVLLSDEEEYKISYKIMNITVLHILWSTTYILVKISVLKNAPFGRVSAGFMRNLTMHKVGINSHSCSKRITL